MITIDIDGSKGIINNLAAYIMERIRVVAAIKDRSIAIDPIMQVSIEDIAEVIKCFIEENRLEATLIRDKDKIRIIFTSIDNDYLEQDLLTCPHCGKISMYEEEMSIHIKTHYIGF